MLTFNFKFLELSEWLYEIKVEMMRGEILEVSQGSEHRSLSFLVRSLPNNEAPQKAGVSTLRFKCYY